MTVKAHSTDKEHITEWLRLQKAQKKDFLIIISVYWSSYIDTKDVIAWAVMQVKHYYNMNWQPQFFAVKDKVLLRLHCKYKLSEIINWKLKQQFIRSFRVAEQIKYLIYYLNLSSAWKIHNIIFIAHLESVNFNNFYNWLRSAHLSAVTVNSAETEDHYKVEKLLQKCVSCWDCDYITEYLIW